MRYMPYGLWAKAERDARKLPPSSPSPIATLIVILFGGLVIFSFASQGGFGIILAIACGVGILQGLSKNS